MVRYKGMMGRRRAQTYVRTKAQSEIGLAGFEMRLDRAGSRVERFAKVYAGALAMSRRAESHCIDAQAEVLGL